MSDLLYDGFLKVKEVEHEGKKYEVVDRGNSVNVLVVRMGKKKRHDRFLVGQQFRAGAGQAIRTNVAGMVDQGEMVRKTAIRETLEESGFKITDANLYCLRGWLLNSPGACSEQTLFYVAVVNNLPEGDPTDTSEGIRWAWEDEPPYGSSLPMVANSCFYKEKRKEIKKCMFDRGVLTKDNILRGE